MQIVRRHRDVVVIPAGVKHWHGKCYYPDHIVNLVVLFIMFFGFFRLFTNSDVIPDSAYYIGFVY